MTARSAPKRCIHARHCVLGAPEVFLANARLPLGGHHLRRSGAAAPRGTKPFCDGTHTRIGFQDRLVKDAVARHDRAYLDLLVSVLASAEEAGELDPGRLGLTSRRLGELLLRAASGASYDAQSATSHRRHLAEIVRAVLAGVAAHTPRVRSRGPQV